MPGPRGLVQQLDQQLHQSNLLPRRAKLLVAVSGGADSVALLRLLHAINQSNYWHWTLAVGHVDHGLRGKESRADVRFVRQVARSLRLPFAFQCLSLRAGSSEDAARQARFKALRELSASRKCTAVVMAHHADDQAETVLMRAFRGCGLEGLAGIAAESRVGGLRILRPLLLIRRAALQEYLHSLRQEWREDSTNASDEFLRNRLRHQVMPLVESLWPRSAEALGRLALVAEEGYAVIRSVARQAIDDALCEKRGRRISFPRDILRSSSPGVLIEMLRQLIDALGVESQPIDQERLRQAAHMIRGTHGGKIIQLGGGITAGARGTTVHLTRSPTTKRRPPK